MKDIKKRIADEKNVTGKVQSIAGIPSASISDSDYSKIIDLAPDIFGISRIEDGKFLLVSNSFCKTFESSEEEIIGHTSTELNLYHENDRPKLISTLKANNGLENYEVRVNTKTGKILTLLISAYMLDFRNEKCFLFSARNITDKKKVEDELNLAREELKEANKQISKNKERLELQLKISEYQSSSLNEFLGYCLEQALILTDSRFGYIGILDELTGQYTISSWSKNGIDESLLDHVRQTINLNNEGYWSRCIKLKEIVCINDLNTIEGAFAPNLNEIPELHRLLSVPVIDEKQVSMVIGVANKQSDYDPDDGKQLAMLMESVRKSAEREKLIEDLKIAKERAEESNKLKTEFLNNMSHEIRTPMNGIIGFADFLSSTEITADEKKYYAEVIHNSCYQLLHIMDNILEISQLETNLVEPQYNEVNLQHLIEHLVQVYKSKSEEKQLDTKIKFHLPEENHLISSDEVLLEKILSNVIDNAYKFTREGLIYRRCR